MSPNEKPSMKRQYSTMACFACRGRKVKCDGKMPVCSSCSNKNRECRYRGVDKRRLPLRVAIELLSSRVEQLCAFIRDNRLHPPPMQEESLLSLTKVLESLGLSGNDSPSKQGADFESKDTTVTSLLKVITASSAPANGDQQVPENLLEVTGNAAQPCKLAIPPAAELVSVTRPEDADELRNTDQYSPGGSIRSLVHNRDAGKRKRTDGCQVEELFGGDSPTLFPDAIGPIFEEPNATFIDDDPPLVQESSDTEDVENLIDQLSDRIGTLKIGPRGETQFYGPTSTFNLVETPLAETSKDYSTQHSNARHCLDLLGINQEVPPHLEDHLISLYFTWHNPTCPVVDQKRYEEARAQQQYATRDSPFHSESLRNAMCAIGAAFEPRYHPSFVSFPRSLTDFFGDRAKALLEVELDDPCVATVQTLVILSNHEIGNTRDARGWLYSGMAIRLAFDLALHLDMSAYVSKGLMSASDADLRRHVFWASYMNDHSWGFALGRPFRINTEDVTVDKPADAVNQFGHNTWSSYMFPDSLDNSSTMLDLTDAVNHHRIKLCETMSSCGYILYGTSGFSKAELQELNENIVAELRNWKTNLPSGLQINIASHNSTYLPHVLLLHMQYYQNIIYAHRPWMSKSYLQPNPPKGPGYLHARDMCIKSAIAIAGILDLYDIKYGLRRIHVQAVSITSSAVLILLFAAVSRYPSRGHNLIVMHLSRCLRALDEFSLSWDSAKRAKQSFMKLQAQWEIRARSIKSAQSSSYAAFGVAENQSSNPIDTAASDSDSLFTQLDPSHCIGMDLDWMFMPDAPGMSGNHI